MRISYLREFAIVAESLNFTASAKRLHIAQPTLSSHIKSLESSLGADLFERDTHHVCLTKAGEIFYRETSQIISLYEKAERAVRDYVDSVESVLLVGYLFYAFKDMIPSVTSTFRNTFPNTRLHLRSFGYKDIVEALCKNDIDIALMLDVEAPLHDLCHVVAVGTDRLSCVVRRDDPLARLDHVSLRDLKTEAFIMPHPHRCAGFAQYYDDLFRKAGYQPVIASYYEDVDTRFLDIESGNAIGIVGNHFQDAMSENVVFIPLDDAWCEYPFAILWKKDNSKRAIRPFVDMVARGMLESPKT